MRNPINNPEKLTRVVTLTTLAFLICWGAVFVLAQIKPFWVDEWRIIYNLKYKNAAALFGPLDFMQQFPRVYLVVIKAFTAPFDYSYFTLRFPSLFIGICVVIFTCRLMKKIYPVNSLNGFLFVMILISSYAFTEFFIQIKQYSMDILLSAVAVWQLLEVMNIGRKYKIGRYVFLCVSFLITPFFSYTYPIAVAPVFAIVFIQTITAIKNRHTGIDTKKLLKQWFTLILSAAAIIVFYIIDVSQLMADGGMHQFWKSLLMDDGFSAQFFINIYGLFSQVGSGLIYNIIFGMLGLLSFIIGINTSIRVLLKPQKSITELTVLYSTLLIVLVLILYVAKKLPVGDPRLNAFTVLSIAILIIHFVDLLKIKTRNSTFSRAIAPVLFIGVIGNVYTTCLLRISHPDYARKIATYVATENAIILAQEKKIPIFITPEVAYPYNKTQNLPYNNTVPGDWVLKTFPAYKVDEHIPVYPINDLSELKSAIQQLPSNITSVMAGDGRSYHIVNR